MGSHAKLLTAGCTWSSEIEVQTKLPVGESVIDSTLSLVFVVFLARRAYNLEAMQTGEQTFLLNKRIKKRV